MLYIQITFYNYFYIIDGAQKWLLIKLFLNPKQESYI